MHILFTKYYLLINDVMYVRKKYLRVLHLGEGMARTPGVCRIINNKIVIYVFREKIAYFRNVSGRE